MYNEHESKNYLCKPYNLQNIKKMFPSNKPLIKDVCILW